jgi:hypothetical protein
MLPPTSNKPTDTTTFIRYSRLNGEMRLYLLADDPGFTDCWTAWLAGLGKRVMSATRTPGSSPMNKRLSWTDIFLT